MKYAAVLALLFGVAQQKVTFDKINVYPTDEQLDNMDLSFYNKQDLQDLDATNLLANKKKSQYHMKNAEHLEHRMQVWQHKEQILKTMKDKMLLLEDDDEDIIGMIDEAEMDLYRIKKFDIDNFNAKQNQIEQYEREVADLVTPEEEGEEDLSYLQSFAAKIDKVDQKMSSVMDNIRAEYKDITFLQCLIYCHLVVFSIAATVAYMFYIPPGKVNYGKKTPENTLINIPVNFQNMKVPKKEIKKQLKQLVKGGNNAKESML